MHRDTVHLPHARRGRDGFRRLHLLLITAFGAAALLAEVSDRDPWA
jgi:hypothetical protein